VAVDAVEVLGFMDIRLRAPLTASLLSV